MQKEDKNINNHQLADQYDEHFYKNQVDGSYKSACLYAKHLTNIYTPLSVVDVGCGRGTWLKAFLENGATSATGFDGSWNSQSYMTDQSIDFFAVDLNNPIDSQGKKYDLAISLEVAEHLHETTARVFIESLASLADVVLFSAAFTGQGGVNHINEQPHTYWADLFKLYGYLPYDIFRPFFWGNADVEFWYQQNTFLYVKESSDLNHKLAALGHNPIGNYLFMNCIHPALYYSKIEDITRHRFKFKKYIKSLYRHNHKTKHRH